MKGLVLWQLMRRYFLGQWLYPCWTDAPAASPMGSMGPPSLYSFGSSLKQLGLALYALEYTTM